MRLRESWDVFSRGVKIPHCYILVCITFVLPEKQIIPGDENTEWIKLYL